MKELRIDKYLADKLTKFLHPNQIKHLAMHKKDYIKFLVIQDNYAKIVVKVKDESSGELVDMYDVHSPELQSIIPLIETNIKDKTEINDN